VRLRLLRDGRERSVSLTLGRRPVEQAQQQQVIDANDVPILQLDTGAHMALIKGIAFTPDGKQLVSASDDKTIRVWDWQSGKTVRIIRGNVGASHEGKYFSMALSPDGRWVAAGGWLHKECAGRCGEIRLFDFSTGRLEALLNKGHVGVVSGLAFSRDGKLLMSGSGLQDLTAIIWDVENRKMLHQLRGHTDQIYALGFSPDKERAYSGGYDRTVKMWSVRDGKEMMTLTGHKDKVQSLAVSPTDGTLATGGWDGETRLWDGRSGRYIRSIQNQGALVGSLNFTPDGKVAGIGHRRNGGRLRLGGRHRQNRRHLHQARQRRRRVRHQPGRASGGDGRRQRLSDPYLGDQNGSGPPDPGRDGQEHLVGRLCT
jgi:WD40 repeat protein